MTRRISKQLRIGNVTVGGNAPIAVQSMTKTDTRDIPVPSTRLRSWRIPVVKSSDWQSLIGKLLKAWHR